MEHYREKRKIEEKPEKIQVTTAIPVTTQHDLPLTAIQKDEVLGAVWVWAHKLQLPNGHIDSIIRKLKQIMQ